MSRIRGDQDGKQAEFAVVLGDPWYGKGIGASLLKQSLSLAKKRGFHTVWGVVLKENRSMLALGKKLGFQIKSRPDIGKFELIIRVKLSLF